MGTGMPTPRFLVGLIDSNTMGVKREDDGDERRNRVDSGYHVEG